MGQSRRPQPARLASKLRQVRMFLDLSQEQMSERLQYVKSPPRPGHISEFERGKREPSLLVLIAYAQLSGLTVDLLVRDELDLPDRLPSIPKHKRTSGFDGDMKAR